MSPKNPKNEVIFNTRVATEVAKILSSNGWNVDVIPARNGFTTIRLSRRGYFPFSVQGIYGNTIQLYSPNISYSGESPYKQHDLVSGITPGTIAGYIIEFGDRLSKVMEKEVVVAPSVDAAAARIASRNPFLKSTDELIYGHGKSWELSANIEHGYCSVNISGSEKLIGDIIEFLNRYP